MEMSLLFTESPEHSRGTAEPTSRRSQLSGLQVHHQNDKKVKNIRGFFFFAAQTAALSLTGTPIVMKNVEIL